MKFAVYSHDQHNFMSLVTNKHYVTLGSYLPQLISSDPSLQLSLPSQTRDDRIHIPSLQRKSLSYGQGLEPVKMFVIHVVIFTLLYLLVYKD